MTSLYFSIKQIIICLIFLKSAYNHDNHENITKKNSSIYLNFTSYFINSTIRTLSEKNFDSIISLNNNSSLDSLILFTIKRCPNCNKVIKTTENTEKYYSKKNSNIKFYKVDCFKSQWISMRFNAFKIPIYIYITKGFYTVFKPENYTEEELINFIENENKEFLEFPGQISYFGVCQKVIHNFTLLIQKNIFFWNHYFTWAIIIFAFLAFLYFEYKIYKVGCCGNNNKERIKQKKNKNDINNKNEKNKEKPKNIKEKINKHNYKDDFEIDEENFTDKNNLKKDKLSKKFKNKLKDE